MMDRRDYRAGFSLVEMVMVMVLIGLMAGIVIPLIRPEKFRLDTAVVEVGSTITAQQRNAILRQHDVVLAMDTTQKRVRVHYDTNNSGTIDPSEQWSVIELGEGVAFGRGGAPARPLSALSISLVSEQDGMPALTFRRNGSASEEAIVYLTSARAAGTVSFAEEARAVEIERATGRVSCFSYATGAWVQTC
jgi:prepilin-type N-terminal cleavage/methylation domain-containing protein